VVTFFVTFLILFFAAGLFTMTALREAVRRLEATSSKKKLKSLDELLVIRLFRRISPKKIDVDFFMKLIITTQSCARFFLLTTILFVFASHSDHFQGGSHPDLYDTLFLVFELILCFLLYISFGEILPHELAYRYPERMIRATSFFAAGVIGLFLPLCIPIAWVATRLSRSRMSPAIEKEAAVKQELFHIIHEASTGPKLDVTDKELISSVLTFHTRIAREIMVPRVDLFSLPYKTTVREAAELLTEEGYSRVPLYKSSVDEIVGFLMYKDLLVKYMEFAKHPQNPEILEQPVDSIAKKAIYAPETQKISRLLQEFRKKKLHMAIVVDEYGGTEGVVTIEDILEEIVGEIADEYDEEPPLYKPLAGGAWLVDAKMAIIDIEEEIHIKIPQGADYDTIGGYITQKTGTIPQSGFVIDHDNFRIDVVKSGERGVEQVRLTSKEREEEENPEVWESEEPS